MYLCFCKHLIKRKWIVIAGVILAVYHWFFLLSFVIIDGICNKNDGDDNSMSILLEAQNITWKVSNYYSFMNFVEIKD